MDERTHARYMSDIAYFLSKMEAEPNSGYFIPIALAYNKLEKYDETIAMCKTAVERFPSNCAAKTFLAEAYVYKGFFDQARELLFDVTAEDDNNYKALKLLGIICKEKGDNTEALKYLTGAFIRSPEDEEVRKMIDELGGTLNPGEIYDERMKRQSQNAAESEEDEDLKTYQEIDKRIRNAEIIMADLVSDTTINARNYEEEEEFHSDNPNDYMPLITKHEEEEEEESLAGSDDDFLPPVTNIAASEEIEPVDTLSQDEASEDLASALQDENKSTEISEESNTDDLLSALSNDEVSEDLASALQDKNKSSEISEESNTDDLLSVLSSDESSEDLASDVQEENKSSEVSEESNTDDLLSALSSDEVSEDLALDVQDENKSSEISEESNTDDLLSALSSDEASEDLALDEQEKDKSIEQEDTEEDTDINSQIDITDKETENTENNEDIIDNIEDSQDTAENIEEDNNIQNNIETDIETDRETNTNEENNIDESITAADSDIEMEEKELLNKEVPSSFGSMTYDDMIDDDFQYGKIVDESYKDSDNPAIDLGESAPFTQGDIMDEILSAVGMTHEDMADDERINISEKDRKLMRLENFLEKVQHNKESR